MTAPADAAPLALTIRIDPAAVSRFEAIVQALEQTGLREVAAHRRFLIVNGTASPAVVSTLAAVPGVASVRPDQTYRAV